MTGGSVNDIDMNIARTLGIDPPRASVCAPATEPPPEQEILPARQVSPEQEILPARQGGYTAQDADRDYAEVRRNLKVVIEKSQEAIEGIIELAQDSQQPRAYEVVAQLIQSNLEANTRLMDLHRRMKDIKRQEVVNKTTNVTNNSIYVGSTADLQKMIRDQRKAMDSGEEPVHE